MRVLVAYDGDESGDRALAAMENWARSSQAEVHLVTVLDPGDVRDTSRRDGGRSTTPAGTPSGQLLHVAEPVPALAEDRSQAVAALLDRTRDRLGEVATRHLGGVAVTIHADIDEHVPEAVIALAQRIGAELIAVGTHGRTGLSHVLMGSVAERIIRQSPLPVLVVGPRVGVPVP